MRQLILLAESIMQKVRLKIFRKCGILWTKLEYIYDGGIKADISQNLKVNELSEFRAVAGCKHQLKLETFYTSYYLTEWHLSWEQTRKFSKNSVFVAS